MLAQLVKACRSALLTAALAGYATSSGAAELAGTGATSESLSLSSRNLNFGAVQMPDASPWLAVTLANRGSAQVSLEHVEVTEGFEARTDCALTLEPGDSCKLELRFVPAGAAVDYRGQAKVYISDGRQYQVDLVGNQTKVLAEISPNELDFGALEVYAPEVSQPFSIRNTGKGDLVIYGIELAKPTSGFQIKPGTCGPFPKSLGALESCAGEVLASPVNPGQLETALVVTTNELQGLRRVLVKGKGLQASISMPGTLVDFGYTTLGGASQLTSVVLTNNGSAPLNIRSVSRVGERKNSFTVTNSCGRAVRPGQRCALSLRATPKHEGDQAAKIEIISNASGSPHLLGVKTYALSMEVLSADGQQVLSSFTLPDVSLNIPNQTALTFIVSNLAKRPQTAVFSHKSNGLIEFSSTDATHRDCLWREKNKVLEVPANSHCLVAAAAYRDTIEPWQGELAISLGGFDKIFPISGRVLKAAPEVLPGDALDWGPVATGEAAGLQRKLILANHGPGDLALSAVNLVNKHGEPSLDFLLLDSTCNSGVIRSGAACSLLVEPVTRDTGTYNAELQLETSAGPYRIALAVARQPAQAAWLTEKGQPVSALRWEVRQDSLDKSNQLLFRNTGEVAISQVAPAAASGFNLAVDANCAVPLEPGGQCVVRISPKRDSLSERGELSGSVGVLYGEGLKQELRLPVAVSYEPASAGRSGTPR